MRIPLTKYGWPQVVIFPTAVIVVMVVFVLGTAAFLPRWAIIAIEAALAIILVWILSFFRDPERCCPSDTNLLLAPADGHITDIEMVEAPPAFLRKEGQASGAALRIGIFLSIFDTHINRAPCNVKVEEIIYKRGKYKNAMNPQAGRVNESNNLGLVRTNSPKDRLIVRQISGAVARRIVCDKTQGQELAGGERFGMIKFGSRTELYVPVNSHLPPRDRQVGAECQAFPRDVPRGTHQKSDARYEMKCLAQVGDKVKAGLTPLVRYEILDGKDAEIEN